MLVWFDKNKDMWSGCVCQNNFVYSMSIYFNIYRYWLVLQYRNILVGFNKMRHRETSIKCTIIMRGKYVRSLFVTNTQNKCYSSALTWILSHIQGIRIKSYILWTGGLSTAPYRSLSISKVFCGGIRYEFTTYLLRAWGGGSGTLWIHNVPLPALPPEVNQYKPPHSNNRDLHG